MFQITKNKAPKLIIMKIISHRGYWKQDSEKNSREAFIRSFELGFGAETDVRDAVGKILISHDPPNGEEISFEEMLQLHSEIDETLPLALNVKADGLQAMAAGLLRLHGLADYFFFDMSIPDMIGYHKAGLRFFTRRSELETEPVLLKQASGVWVDLFQSDWITESIVNSYFDLKKKVCLVSPDLHKRDHRPFWEDLSKWDTRYDDRLMLCTDFPEQAQRLFKKT